MSIPIFSSFTIVTYQLIAIVVLTFLSFLLPLLVITRDDLPAERYNIIQVKDTTSESLNYLVAIVLGLVIGTTDPFSKISTWVLLLLFYLLYDTGGLFYIQPTLILLGFKVFKCEVNGQHETLIISRHDIKKGLKVKVFEITEKISTYR